MTTPTQPTNTELAETLAPPKPGYVTSEFWLTLVTAVIGVLVGLHVIGPDFAKAHEGLVNAPALLGSLLAPGLYAISRGIIKHAQTQAAAAVLNQRMAYGLSSEQKPVRQPSRAKRAKDSGFALIGLIGAILLVVGVIWLIVGLGHHHFDVWACIVAAIGLVLLYFDGNGRTTRF